MFLSEILSPIIRQKWWFLALFLIGATAFFATVKMVLPDSEKTTIYFTIKPQKTDLPNTILDPAENAMKVAEMIAGWARNPGFREEILQEAGVQIPKFKRKITARKQNRMNVFWTLKLAGAEQVHSQKIAASTVTIVQHRFAEWNAENAVPFAMTSAQVSGEKQIIPLSWIGTASLVFGLFMAGLLILMGENARGRVIFYRQIKDIFPQSSLLKIDQKTGQHDQKLLEQFILTFDSPRLIGTFPAAAKTFSLAPRDSIDEAQDTPILIIQLGETSLRELENLSAIFGDGLGIIVFEK